MMQQFSFKNSHEHQIPFRLWKTPLFRRLIMGDTVPELGRRPSLVASLKSKSRSLLARRSTEHESFESTGEHDYAKNIAQKHNNILEKYCTGAQPCSEIYSRSDCSLSLIALRFTMTDCCFARSWILSSLTIKQLCGAGKVPCLCYNWVSRVLASLFIYQKFAIYDYIWSNWATHVLASLFLEEAALPVI